MNTNKGKAGRINTEQTHANPQCSSLSAGDAQQATTPVSCTQPDLDTNNILASAMGHIVDTNFVPHKQTFKGIRKWRQRTNDALQYFLNRNDGSAQRQNDVYAMGMIALLQAHCNSHNIDWHRVSRDDDWKIDEEINSVYEKAINALTGFEWIVQDGTCTPLFATILKKDDHERYSPFIDWIMNKIINSSLQSKILYQTIGPLTFRLPGTARFHMLRSVLLEMKDQFEIFSI